jgi:hypothetical protein
MTRLLLCAQVQVCVRARGQVELSSQIASVEKAAEAATRAADQARWAAEEAKDSAQEAAAMAEESAFSG